ncbi:MAG: right-handed parallel beta-helix repeat-containing protein [Flavobacteriales bacterium]|nr:right-handed parallel beta-helix repeat-containing protein [Flavobacteriales bacterium]
MLPLPRLVLCSALCCTAPIAVQAQLNGSYTIDPGGGGNYISFTQAVNALTTLGLNGPVVFNVASGTYTEQITIPDISGTSATNTITFRSQALDSAAVVLTWPTSTSATNNFTVQLNGVDRIILDRITLRRNGSDEYGRVIDYAGPANAAGSQFTRITHCRVMGSNTASPIDTDLIGPTTNSFIDSVRIDHCRLVGGRYAVNWNTFSLVDKVLIEDNVITGQQYAGARLSHGHPAYTVRNNVITQTATIANGLSLSGLEGGAVHGNRITTVGDALSLSSFGTSFYAPHVYNNTLRSSAGSGVVVQGTSGLWLDHNSISATVYGVHFSFGTNSVASFRNNAIRSGNYTVYRQTTSTNITFASHCALKRATAGALAFWGGAQNTLASLQAASGKFASSVVADPLFFDTTNDLHAYAMELDAAGTPIAFITADVDGEARNPGTPDIGADEFQPMLWNEAFNTCAAADPITSTGSGTDQWIYKDHKVVARFNDNGQNLGTVDLDVYVNNAALRASLFGQFYMDRNWHLSTTNPISTSASVRLFFSGNEFGTYAGTDPVVAAIADAGVALYDGPSENCDLLDNPGATSWTPIYPAPSGTEPRIASSGGTSWYSAVVVHDGELYITTMGLPLPVELLYFNAVPESDVVRCSWATGSELNNDHFSVERSADGSVFIDIGDMDGAGNSQVTHDYLFIDGSPLGGLSYYRLRQTDLDGTEKWSEVVAVWRDVPNEERFVYPNPCEELLFISGGDGTPRQASITDAVGRIVLTGSFAGTLDVSTLSAGTYALQVGDGPASVKLRFVKN